MKRNRLLPLLAALLLTIAPATARAQDDEDVFPDARLSGYAEEVAIEGGSVTTWFLFIGLAIVGLGVMFKDAKRSHLD